MISKEGQVRRTNNSTRIFPDTGFYDSESCQLFMRRIRDSTCRIVYAYDTPQVQTMQELQEYQ